MLRSSFGAVFVSAVVVGVPLAVGCGSDESIDATAGGTASTGAQGVGGDGAGATGTTTSAVGIGGGLVGAGGGEPAPPPSDVEVVITADNAYGFGYGDATTLANYFGGVEAITAAEIFDCDVGPERYLVPAADAAAGNFLYIVAYADKSTTQGVLGQFRRVEGGGGAGGGGATGDTVYTGTDAWEVCATGQDFVPGSGGPDLASIEAALMNCTWVDSTGDATGRMQVGEDNTTDRTAVEVGNEFPITCDIDGEARWMWFNWDPAALDWPTSGSPFIWPGGATGNPDGQFLIFRLGAESVPPPIPR
ncbi:MAG: hypothetical protein AAF715_06740 [Myxococcota bacterium]